MSKNHPLAKKEIRNLKDLKKFDLIRIDRNLISLPLFEEAVRTHDIKGSIEFENGNWEMLKHFAKENNFAAIVSTICINKNDSDLATKNLIKFFPEMTYRIAVRSGQILKPIVEDFIKFINHSDHFSQKKN
jgi:DNA-binding transcriptional LysR family regulator